jgi:hypothetical protein
MKHATVGPVTGTGFLLPLEGNGRSERNGSALIERIFIKFCITGFHYNVSAFSLVAIELKQQAYCITT